MAGLTVWSAACAAQSGIVPGEYLVTRETLLPHLEEALRYATTRQAQCLSGVPVERLFPLLQHEAFAGCALQPADDAPAQRWQLHCANPGAASGVAWLEAEPRQFRAVLELKMGGKNMTLSQRVTGTRSADCKPARID